MKLNVGCGPDIQPGYVNIDTRILPGIDVAADVRCLPYPPGSVDEIRAMDVYEHVGHQESIALLQHWNDLLVPGGLLTIQAPCLDTLIRHFVDSESLDDIEAGIRMLFGGQDYAENTHRTICQSSLIMDYLRRTGFELLRYRYEAQNIIIIAIKGGSKRELLLDRGWEDYRRPQGAAVMLEKHQRSESAG